MLPRLMRLNRSADIQRVVKTGQRHHTPHFTAYYLPQTDSFKATVVVGKRVHKSAVVRHRYQRWLRALLGQSRSQLPATGSLVIIGRPTITRLQRQNQLQAPWQDLLAWLQQKSS